MIATDTQFYVSGVPLLKAVRGSRMLIGGKWRLFHVRGHSILGMNLSVTAARLVGELDYIIGTYNNESFSFSLRHCF